MSTRVYEYIDHDRMTYAFDAFGLDLGSDLVDHLGAAKVSELHTTGSIDQDIGALDVAMYNAVRMQILEAHEYLARIRAHDGFRQRSESLQ